jgi:hypothetical protein
MGAEATKASCHSDYVDAEAAQELQDRTLDLVELTTP